MPSLTFAMNRTCAPHLPLGEFIALARGAAVSAVEIRNDVAGQEFMDGTPAADLRRRLDDAGLKVASVNALQRFNDWTSEREAEARALIAYAAKLGAPGLVMCPVIDEAHGWLEAELERNLRDALRGLRPILADQGVTGYVEPLGMRGSTLMRQAKAVEAVADIDGWDNFALCYDTFQYFRCGDDRTVPQHVGLVHVSGISRSDLTPGELSEPDRELVFVDDRVGNVVQLRALASAGFKGYVSMEPFSPRIQQDPSLGTRLQASFAYLNAAVGAEGTSMQRAGA
ncbi:TIM barrel protein [Rubellimicrobium aerolatum]|uniref:TIM barrel protein n=1 Tax=Rubellimicrobium aerolatum TaxID=490979 RepID=A0ABW0SD17_9RHOB|nr:TIM barrel protein [Rubellimicrobium aerolatum]MBP1806688.1 2-keto-myo-inositol isomerase [Rubellimicrobium aerolatum]